MIGQGLLIKWTRNVFVKLLEKFDAQFEEDVCFNSGLYPSILFVFDFYLMN